MQAVKRIAPEVIHDFRDHVREAGTFVFQQNRLEFVPSDDLKQWEARWHLKCDAIRRWAVQTLATWGDDETLRQRVEWKLPPLNWAMWREHNRENLSDPLAPIGALPEWEDEQDFQRRAQRHYEARKAYLETQGYTRPPRKNELAHFEWLVRFQIQGKDYPEMSVAVNQERSTVQEAVTSTARLFGLRLRPRAKGGRPRATGRSPRLR